jgi:hypothetical protein
MRPTVVTRRLMPGTMWGAEGYPSLGCAVERRIGGVGAQVWRDGGLLRRLAWARTLSGEGDGGLGVAKRCTAL